MKFKNLKILKDNGFNVPNFTTNIDEVTWNKSAVRSSADLEDRENSSCAGLFDSFLNVSKDELQEKIDLVRDSYKANGANVDSPVIIQKMIQSELSGVLFTANPMGILNEMVIVVGSGLGHNVVEDKVDTTTYCYNIDDSLYDYFQNGDSPILEQDMIKEIVEQGKKIETLFGCKMDIEFGIERGKLYILQARPITTLSNENIIILDNSNIVESYPGVSLPMTQSFVKEMYYKIFRNCIRRVSNDMSLVNNMDDTLRNMVDMANGRIYYRISNWYTILKLLPFEKKIIKVWQDMLGVRNLAVTSHSISVKFSTKMKIVCNFFKYLRKTPREMENLNKFFDNRILGFRLKLDDCITVSDYLTLFENIKETFISRWDITLVNDMYTFIYTGLSGKRNKKLLANIKGLESMKPMTRMNALIDAYHNIGANSYKYKTFSREYINLYGDRCLGELKLETETYRTNPNLLDEYVRTQKKNILDKEIKIPQSSGNFFVERAKIGISNREKSRMNRSRLFGLAREVFLRIGKVLVKEGKLSYYRDIFYLYYDELFKPNLDYKGLVRQRKLEFAAYEKIPTYSRMVFSGEVMNKQRIGNVSILSDSSLYGVGTSAGIVEGEVIVVTNPDVTIDVTDKIIVTKMTDPGWVFLIRNCKGIIAEQGSLLSHTAIISRELGKPAIVNVKNAMISLRSGEKVRIDGLKGKIERLEL